jgi:hypothetical protein
MSHFIPLLFFILQAPPNFRVVFGASHGAEDTDPQFQQAAAGVVRQMAQDAAQSEADAVLDTHWIHW